MWSRVSQLRIKARLIDLPERVEIGFFKLANLKSHANIVAGARDLPGRVLVEDRLSAAMSTKAMLCELWDQNLRAWNPESHSCSRKRREYVGPTVRDRDSAAV